MEIRKAFIKTVPVMAGYVVLGMGFGILMKDAGFGFLWSLAMSLFIFAGSMQFAGVELLAGPASILNTVITTVMINARHLFYSISMLDKYKDAGKYKPYLIFALTDETYSLLSDGKVPEGLDPDKYRFFVSLFDHSYWVAGSMLGSLAGEVIPFDTAGIEFSMTALFIATFAEQWISSKDHFPAAAGAVLSLVSLLAFGADSFLIPAMIMIMAALLLRKGKMPDAGTPGKGKAGDGA